MYAGGDRSDHIFNHKTGEVSVSSLQRLIDHIEDLESHMQAFISENLQYVDINETLIQLTRLRISWNKK